MASIRDQIRTAFRQDGQDHLNLSVFGKTPLGQIASPEYRKRFFIPHLGEFGSARCFANWACSGGDDSLRFNFGRYNANVPMNIFRMYMLYGKYFQLLANRNLLIQHKDLANLSWVMYKSHLTGVKEFDRWEQFPDQVKAMVRHIATSESRAKFDWNSIRMARIPQMVQDCVRDIAIAAGTDPADVIDINKADDVAQERKAARKEQLAAEKAARQAAEQSDAGSQAPSLAPTVMPETAGEATSAEAQSSAVDQSVAI